MKPINFPTVASLVLAAVVLSSTFAPAIPKSGRPVPELTDLDDMMETYMESNDISAGVLGLMQDGRIVYLRGFGVDYWGNDLPENALMRIASLTKPLTAAAVRQLVPDTVNTNAFDLDQPGGGLLDYDPWPSVGDNRLQNVTVEHLLNHQGGQNRDVDGDGTNETPDWTYQEVNIASQMGVVSPPGRISTLRFILGQPLQQNPGTGNSGSTYSNFGYMSLGLIAEQESGQSLLSYLRQNVLTPQMWVPSTELLMGRTFRADQSSREPAYDDQSQAVNVYDPNGDPVDVPYGAWDHEARTGQGRIVLSAATMLTFADTYRTGYNGGDIGKRLDDEPLDIPSNERPGHSGSFFGGTQSAVSQRTDGLRMFVVFNKTHPTAGSSYARTMRSLVNTYLDNTVIPAINRTSDGFWTQTAGGGVGSNVGGYHQPFVSFQAMMKATTSGSKVRLLSGSTDWSGTIKKRMRFDAPLGGVATIGK